MYRKLPLFVLFLSLVSVINAASVGEQVARRVASNFISLKSQQYNHSISSTAIREVLPLVQGQTLAYAVNFEKGGFVLISADDAAKPVIAYSWEGSFSTDNIPPVIDEWMQMYYKDILDIKAKNIPATFEISQEWSNLLNNSASGERDNREISPLLSTTWDQGAKYNDLCPEASGGPGGRVWAGCVATAMSQIINYWRYPLQGTGSHGYNSNYGYLFADFGASTYDYNQMNASIGTEHNYEMAEIQYHCGVAVDMMYSPTGSGAYSDDAAEALRTYFGYASDLNLEYKDNYSETEWANLLMSNLDNGWPMYYHGFGSGGHAFNVDGYQGTDYFHFNWGWSGSYNGYYYLDNLNPGGSNFSIGQGAIVNFRPNPSNYPYYCTGVTTLNRHNGTIEDGSGPIDNYTAGLNCGWVIAPEDSVTGLSLAFDKFDLATGDVLNIFDGMNSSGQLIGSYTGTNLPGNITPASGKMYIEFLTSGTTGKGWKAHYSSNLVNFCSGIDTHTEAMGTFTDGSGNRDYRNGSICKNIIEPENAGTITIAFNQFNTEAGADKVKIYDMITQTQYAEYSGDQLPEAITIPSGKVYVLFVSNGTVTAPGWELSYTSTVTDVNDITIGDANVYCTPNPATDWLRTEVRSPRSENLTIDLVSADGRTKRIYNGLTGQQASIIMTDISMLEPGLYILRYRSESSSGSRKIVVQ